MAESRRGDPVHERPAKGSRKNAGDSQEELERRGAVAMQTADLPPSRRYPRGVKVAAAGSSGDKEIASEERTGDGASRCRHTQVPRGTTAMATGAGRCGLTSRRVPRARRVILTGMVA